MFRCWFPDIQNKNIKLIIYTTATGCEIHATWRWGTLSHLLRKLLRVRSSLRMIWDPHKFLHGTQSSSTREVQLEMADKESLNVTVMTKAIRSSQWWMYGEMLSKLHTVQDNAGKWAESCPCHDWLQLQEVDSDDPHANRRMAISSAARLLEDCRTFKQQKTTHH